MSISSAPSAIARFVSKTLVAVTFSPMGNPTTHAIFTAGAFLRKLKQSATYTGCTQTEQNPYSTASSQSFRISERVAVCLSRVWSIILSRRLISSNFFCFLNSSNSSRSVSGESSSAAVCSLLFSSAAGAAVSSCAIFLFFPNINPPLSARRERVHERALSDSFIRKGKRALRKGVRISLFIIII